MPNSMFSLVTKMWWVCDGQIYSLVLYDLQIFSRNIKDCLKSSINKIQRGAESGCQEPNYYSLQSSTDQLQSAGSHSSQLGTSAIPLQGAFHTYLDGKCTIPSLLSKAIKTHTLKIPEGYIIILSKQQFGCSSRFPIQLHRSMNGNGDS